MKKTVIFIFSLICIIISSAIGFSNWVIINSTDSKSANSDRFYTVNVYYQTNIESFEWIAVANPEPVELSRHTISGDKNSLAKTYYDTYKKDDEFNFKYDYNSTEKFEEFYKIITSNRSWNVKQARWEYTVEYGEYRKVTHTKKSVWTESNNYTNAKILKVKNGSKITPLDILTDYQNCGFYTSSDFSSFFDFSAPITENKDIYIKYLKTDSLLSNKIDSLSGILNLYDSNSGGIGGSSSFDVFTSNDSYDLSSKTAFLGACTINSGASLNLTYGSNNVNLEPTDGAVGYDDIGKHRTSTDSYIATEVTNTASKPNNCALKIKLSGDMVVNGNLTIGAFVGGNQSNFYSYIIGDYTELDLNGHSLIVNNGGVVTSYGVISDSIGSGSIIVKEGGRLLSTFTVFDGRGGNQSTFGSSKGQCPFTNYSTPYIKCKMKFEYGSKFDGYLKLDLGSLGITNTTVPLLDKSGNNSLFNWNSSNTNGYVLVTPYIVSKLYNSNHYTNTDTKNYYYRRYRIEVFADIDLVNASFSANISIKKTVSVVTVELDQSFEIYISRSGLPISPFFDIILKPGADINIPYEVNFYPGSSLRTEKNSAIHFTKIGNFTYNSITVKKTVLVVTISKTMPGETKYLCGSIMAYSYNFTKYSGYAINGFSGGIYTSSNKFFTYFSPHNIIIDGNITFDTSIDTSLGQYRLSGPINLSLSATNSLKNNRNYLRTYDIKGEQYGSTWFNGDTILESNNSNAYVLISSYNCTPLVSYNTAFIYDKTNQIEGTYNPLSGIFTANDNSHYFLKTSENVLQGGTGGSYQDNPVDRDVTPTLATSVTDNGIVNDGTNNYVSFLGVFIQVTELTSADVVKVSINKFISNPSSSMITSNDALKQKYNSPITLTYQSTGLWKKTA